MAEQATTVDAYLEALRAEWTAGEVLSKIAEMRPIRAVVVGDIIIDEYHYCKAIGKASKSATLTAKYLDEERHAGGVLAVANHMAGFVDSVELVTYLGSPQTTEPFIHENLRPNVVPRLITDPERPVVVKRRYVDPFQLNKMFEVMWIGGEERPSNNERRFLEVLGHAVADCDLVVAADFGHGALSQQTVEMLARKAPFLAISVQTNSGNFGYNVVTKYPRTDYFCIDEEELRLANHDRYGPLEPLLDRTASGLSCASATVTRGARGAVTWSSDGARVSAPVLSREVVDSVGAGDAFLSIASLSARAGLPADLITFLGNCVGALAVTIVGNREPIDVEAVRDMVNELLERRKRVQ
jgi:bifunctional ADP-heptose synthase (sugar kinase/adenylyltransferase)